MFFYGLLVECSNHRSVSAFGWVEKYYVGSSQGIDTEEIKNLAVTSGIHPRVVDGRKLLFGVLVKIGEDDFSFRLAFSFVINLIKI